MTDNKIHAVIKTRQPADHWPNTPAPLGTSLSQESQPIPPLTKQHSTARMIITVIIVVFSIVIASSILFPPS